MENIDEIITEKIKDLNDKLDNLKLIQEEICFLKEDIERNYQLIKNKISLIMNNYKCNNNINNLRINDLNSYVTFFIIMQVISNIVIFGIIYFISKKYKIFLF